MIRLFVRMRRRRGLTGISDRMKRAYDKYISDVLRFLFLHLESLEENQSPFKFQDLACHIYVEDVDMDKFPLNQNNLSKYCEEIRKELHKTYPYLKKIQKMPKRQLKTKEQLEEEAKIVHKLVFESGEKYMPEKEGIRYHIISM
jgi:hypothetical protein